MEKTVSENEEITAIGLRLQSKRMELNISVAQVSNELKIRESYVLALENGDLEAVPSSNYYFGYLKNYSNYLGMCYNDLIKLPQSSGKNIHLKPQNITSPKDVMPSKLVLLISALITAGLYLLYYILN